MNGRRLNGWGWLVLITALAILSYLGNHFLFYSFAGLLIPVLIIYPLVFCARCTNDHCPMNACSSDFIFRLRPKRKYMMLGYSDCNVLWPLIFLGAVLVIPFIAVWQFSRLAFFMLLFSGIVNLMVFKKLSCSYCTNNCPMNKNMDYWHWKERNSKKR